MKRNGDPIISEFINLQKREMRGIVLSFDVPMNPRIDRMNGEGRGKKKKDGRSRTAATLYSTKRVCKRRGERHGRAAVDCSKLHQRRDNRVVDCVDRYSIFAELVCHSADNQLRRKIQLSLPTGLPRSIGNRFTDLLVALNRNRQLPSPLHLVSSQGRIKRRLAFKERKGEAYDESR